MKLSLDQIKTIVDIVGRDGAIHALFKSTQITSDHLLELAKSVDLTTDTKISKQTLAEKLVRFADRRILKTIDDMKSMNKDDITAYLESTDCDSEDIINLLSSIDLAAKAKLSKKAAIEFAAIQISSLGIFERIAT